ncbi:signal peptidase II [Paenibacillus sp. XY044]|uniref:signal peptidase II n=1 Tax=Paenibacillus sp. XY044 TaxID=2026089 RepID=UPI000B9853B2|nr:signal peptidase II [Paenibacillus sp. XY044]OZB96903.1 signal peptidase II [Paenibacillus sp. XY044]
MEDKVITEDYCRPGNFTGAFVQNEGGVLIVYRYYFIAMCVIIADHAAKWLVSAYMKIGQEIPLIPGILDLASIRNRGAAFGILQGQILFFIIATTVVLIGIMLYLPKAHRENTILPYGLALILGGAMGNFIDRVFKGEVVDMIQVHFFNFPVFNVADSFLCIGVIIGMIHPLIGSRNKDKELQELVHKK